MPARQSVCCCPSARMFRIQKAETVSSTSPRLQTVRCTITSSRLVHCCSALGGAKPMTCDSRQSTPRWMRQLAKRSAGSAAAKTAHSVRVGFCLSISVAARHGSLGLSAVPRYPTAVCKRFTPQSNSARPCVRQMPSAEKVVASSTRWSGLGSLLRSLATASALASLAERHSGHQRPTMSVLCTPTRSVSSTRASVGEQ